jgi:molybdate transport system substrate-binding protein
MLRVAVGAPIWLNGWKRQLLGFGDLTVRRGGLMTGFCRFFAGAVVTLCLSAISLESALAQVRVMTSGGFAAPLREMLPEFETSSGISVEVILGKSQGNDPAAISAQLARGVAADIVILSREGLNDLVSANRIVAHSDMDLAKTPLGLSVRAGAVKPDISTVEAFKNALLRAKSVTYPSSTTGIYMTTTLFPRLGIAEAVIPKSSNAGIAAVAKGDAEIAIQPVSELLHVPGTDFVGTLPNGIQYLSVFSAALVAGPQKNGEAEKLMTFLGSAKAKDAMRNAGMEPLASH